MSQSASESAVSIGDGCTALEQDWPESVAELQRAVVDRVLQGHAIYPIGGATALDFGGTPRRAGVAIATRALSKVIDYPSADMTITVEAGLTLGELRAVLAEKQQRLLVDAPSPARATLGGIFATNTTGPRRFGVGRPRDQILGVGFVTADGALVKGGGRVVKNVAGYDFPRLLTGSMGTLGIVTQMTLKVRPRPDASALAWSCYDDAAQLDAALERLNTSATRPIAVDILNRAAADHVGRSGTVPSAPWVLVVGFEDNAASVDWQLGRLDSELAAAERCVFRDEGAAWLWDALIEFQAAELGPVTMVANVRPATTVRIGNSLDARRWAVQAHAGNGIVRALALGALSEAEAADAVATIRAATVADGGNTTLSRCPAAWKPRLKVWGEPRPDWTIAERLKQALDPQGVFNPGRFVGTI